MQSDPKPGQPFEWVVGVREREQVLVCPECRREPAALEELEKCLSCGSPKLRMMLGAVVCRACGAQS